MNQNWSFITKNIYYSLQSFHIIILRIKTILYFFKQDLKHLKSINLLIHLINKEHLNQQSQANKQQQQQQQINFQNMSFERLIQIKNLVLLYVLIHIVSCVQTIILQDLKLADQQTLILAKQVSNIIQYERTFKQEPFKCLAILPSNLTKNSKQKINKLNITYNYQPQPQSLQTKDAGTGQKQIIGHYEDYDYDKILDLLHGTCAVHETNEFLYEYCHKERVRQFDNLQTKQRMGKQKYEDIILGYYNYQEAILNSEAKSDQSLKTNSKAFQVQYTQSGQLKVLETFIQNIPNLSEQNRILLKETIAKQIGANNANLNKIGENAGGQGKSVGQGINKNGPQIVIQTIPIRSVVYDKDNLFTVDMTDHREYELDKMNKVIHLNFPIVKTSKYYLTTQFIYEVTCQYKSDDKIKLYVSRATVVSPYELIFHGNTSKCQRIIQVSLEPIYEKIFKTPFYVNKLRGNEDFLYGQVDQSCTNNWDWSMNGPGNFFSQRENYLQKDTTILLGFTYNNSEIFVTEHHPVTIKQIIAPGVIKLYENIEQILMPSKRKQQIHSSWISSCRIISKGRINHLSLATETKIISNNLIKIKQSQKLKAKKPGDKLLCLCKFEKYVEEYLQMPITLGNKVFQANEQNSFYTYYQYFQKKTVKTYSQEGQGLYKICQALTCYDVLSSEQTKPIFQNKAPWLNQLQAQQNTEPAKHQEKNKQKRNKFTAIEKLTAGNPVIQENLQTQNKIIMINIFQHGLIKLYTQSRQGDDHFVYLITSTFLLKIKLFPNGTKQIISENSFYENQTIYFNSWVGSSILIHKQFIWRGLDKIVLPRMDFIGQIITKIERVSGIAYVRTLNLESMKHKLSNMVSKIKTYIENHFRVKKFPIYKSQQKTISINQEGANQNPDQIASQTAQQTVQQNIQVKQEQQSIEEQYGNHKVQETSKIDFSESYFKPLNRSVSVRYQYFHGQLCGSPINKNRRTDVIIRCGEPWLKIQTVEETSPCIYELRVSTRLLCNSQFKKVIEKVDKLVTKKDSRVRLQKSVVCYPEDSWDNVQFSYHIDTKDILFEGS